jgi:lipopolysaccharide transport system ATP-binding protein
MSDIAIKVENLSKLYRLGEVGTGALRHDINRLIHRIRGKEDPYRKIGQENDRTEKAQSEYVWALRDINFEVKHGEVLGIIGRNGAGKSTLLKILSKITGPTEGSISLNGRVASLLEVGTGFHPELSGRENIFLNGAILGMRKWEVKKKFDEIVDFSGVERYIDTPVKRYSSGMYVRLAFAVAAHLEPEILIVDEVLAVGDAEFQKRCMGKMKDVSGQGRTVLFVSHNMEAVQNLCSRAMVLYNGKVLYEGGTSESVLKYLQASSTLQSHAEWLPGTGPGNQVARLRKISVSPGRGTGEGYIDTLSGFSLEIEIENLQDTQQQLDITYHLVDERGILVNVNSTGFKLEPGKYTKGLIKSRVYFGGNILNEGVYTISRLLLVKDRGYVVTEWNDTISFEIVKAATGYLGQHGVKEGVVKTTNTDWEMFQELI